MEGDSGRSITRTRPSLTCLPCKRRKVKCDKKRPDCEQCGKFNDKCVYGDALPQNASRSRAQKRQRDENTRSNSYCTEQAQATIATRQQQVTRTSPGTVDRNDLHALPSPHFTNDSDLDCIDMYMPSPNTLLATPNFAYPSIPTRSDALPIDLNHMAVIPQHDWTTQFEPMSTQTGNIDPVDRWVSRIATDSSHIYPALQVAHTDGGTARAADAVASGSQGFGVPHSPFWAFASNRTDDCDLLLRFQQSKYRSRSIDSRRWDDTCKTLLCLPPKKICDVLLSSFLLSVRPLLPLVHGPTLQADYDSFWAPFYRYKVSKKPEELVSHHEFLCLLWAVLFCGAVAASPEMFREASIQIRNTRTLLCRLREKLDETVVMSQFNEMPTLNGLVSMLLAEECDPDFDEIAAAPPFAYKCMRAARTLDLHKEAVVAAKNGVESELARRVWYHVVQLEVLATITSGASLSYYSSDESYDTRMPHDIHDSEMRRDRRPTEKPNTNNANSSAMQLAIGRVQLNRVLRKVVETCYSTRPPSDTDLEELLLGIGRYEELMDGIIARIEVRGLPEQGHVPTKLLRADPMIHERLYRDDPNEETVFNAFARIMLSMMKGYVSILITRHFLSRATGEQRSKLWNSIITICTKFLRNYLHLAQLPAFSPYHWFCPGKIQPLQECMIILAYLKESPQDENKHMLSYLLDEVFDLFGTGETLANKATLSLRPKEGSKAAWEVLQSLREEVTSRKDSPLERDISPLANSGGFGGGFGQVGTQSLEGHFHDLANSGGQFLSCPQDEDDSWLDVLDYTA